MTPVTVFPTKISTREELCIMEQATQKCGIIVFGASGDLTHRKLIPSLFTRREVGALPRPMPYWPKKATIGSIF